MRSFVGLLSVVFGMEVCRWCVSLHVESTVYPLKEQLSSPDGSSPPAQVWPWSGLQSSVLTGQAWRRDCYTLFPCLFTHRLVMLVKAVYLTLEECNCDPYLWSSWNDLGGGGIVASKCLCQNVLPSCPKLLPDNHLFPPSWRTKFLFMCVSQTESPLLILGSHICPEI